MTKNEQMRGLCCQCLFWLHMTELDDKEKLRRIEINLVELKHLLAIPRKTYTVFGESDNKTR